MAPGPGMELASERASGHCGLVPPEDSWRRTQQVRPGPGQHKLSPALSLLAHRPLVGLGPRLRPDVFAPSMGPEARGDSEVPASASSTRTPPVALASDVYGTRNSPGGSQSDRGVISFWNAPPSRSLSRVLPCPLPVTLALRGWGGRSRREFTLRPGPFPSRRPPPSAPQTPFWSQDTPRSVVPC